ncbi:hypothetical protein ZWY2020_052220 [Hordeum vulgare]|nr:hypothetical protein ZWY2020_052220 [Hordeum vulgare]
MAYSSCLNRSLKPNKLLLGRIDGAIQVRSHVDLTFYSLVGSGRSGGPPRLLSSRESMHPLSVYGELSLEHRLRFVLNGKMEHLTTHLQRPRTTRSLFPFFHAFPSGLEKAAINRTFRILPSFQEEREIIFPKMGAKQV